MQSRLPLLVHIHLPKTAGTSFRSLLERTFGENHANLYVHDTHFIYEEGWLNAFVAERPSLRSISSHFIRTFPPRLGGREALYVTFLRNPIENFISYLTYVKKYYTQIPDRNLLDCVPPGSDNLPLREMARWLLFNQRDLPFKENYITNYFARRVYASVVSDETTGKPLYTSSRLLLAKVELARFLAVGITERMQDSQRLLEHIADTFGIEVPHGDIAVENVSAELRDDLAWTDRSDEVGAALHESLAEDFELYHWAAQRFENALLESASMRNENAVQLTGTSKTMLPDLMRLEARIGVAREAPSAPRPPQ